MSENDLQMASQVIVLANQRSSKSKETLGTCSAGTPKIPFVTGFNQKLSMFCLFLRGCGDNLSDITLMCQWNEIKVSTAINKYMSRHEH